MGRCCLPPAAAVSRVLAALAGRCVVLFFLGARGAVARRSTSTLSARWRPAPAAPRAAGEAPRVELPQARGGEFRGGGGLLRRPNLRGGNLCGELGRGAGWGVRGQSGGDGTARGGLHQVNDDYLNRREASLLPARAAGVTGRPPSARGGRRGRGEEGKRRKTGKERAPAAPLALDERGAGGGFPGHDEGLHLRIVVRCCAVLVRGDTDTEGRKKRAIQWGSARLGQGGGLGRPRHELAGVHGHARADLRTGRSHISRARGRRRVRGKAKGE